MVIFRHPSDEPPIQVSYSPRRWTESLPVEVVERFELLARIEGRAQTHLQRADFHQLIVCTSGTGTHHVDYEPVELSAGRLLRIYPGQVQQFVPDSDLDALMVIWPHDSHHPDPEGRQWFPGSGAATSWQLEDDFLAKVLGWVEEIRQDQERFNGSIRNTELMKALLCSLLLRLAVDLPESPPSISQLPPPYLDLRGIIEQRLYERPRISELASDLGYSTRTLDRACKHVSDQTAKEVLDERIALEIHRLLTHSNRPIARIAADFGFSDPSNFSKFVKRHLGRLPGQVRDARP